MVFDTLKKSLSDFTNKVTSPIDTITEVTKSMKKKVIGPDADLLLEIENSLRYTPYADGVKKQFTKLISKIKRLKIAATKKTKILEALSLLQIEIEKEVQFTTASVKVPELLKKFERVIKKGSLPTAYEKGKFVLGTVTLAATATNSVTTLFQETQLEITTLINDLKQPFADQYTLPLKEKYDYKAAKKTFHDAWKKAIDTLIDDEYDVSKVQKQLLYTTNELSRQQRLLEKARSNKRTGKDDKDTTRRINHAKQRIEVLVKKDIAGGLKAVDAGLKKIAVDEKAVLDLWKKYTSEYSTWSKYIGTWLATNRSNTKKVIVAESKKREASAKRLATQIKKLNTLYKKVATTCGKDSTYTNLEGIKALLQEDITATDIYTHDVVGMLATYAYQIQHHHKDLGVYHTLLEDRMTYTYGTQILEKERVIQLKLLLGIKTRHADLSNEIWHNLLDVENKIEVNLKQAIAHTKQHADTCKKQRKAYETEIGSRSKEVKNYTTAIKELRGAERAWSYMSSRLESMYISEVNVAYAQALDALKVNGKEHITNLKKINKKIATSLIEQKKTLATLEKKEKPTTAMKKEIKALADTIHNGELYIDVLTYHLSTEEEHQDDQKQLSKNYTKIAATQMRKKDFYEKQATTSIGKMKKYNYFKESLTLPKKIRGKRI